MRSVLAYLALALLCVFVHGEAHANESDVITVIGSAPVTTVRPFKTVVVHPIVPAPDLDFKPRKATPGHSCRIAKTCDDCTSRHYCTWTTAGCLARTSIKARALAFRGKATDVCPYDDPYTREVVLRGRKHELVTVKKDKTREIGDRFARLHTTVVAGMPVYVNKDVKVINPVAMNIDPVDQSSAPVKTRSVFAKAFKAKKSKRAAKLANATAAAPKVANVTAAAVKPVNATVVKN